MATVHVVLSRVRSRGDTGGTLPVLESVPSGVDTVTSSGTSALSSLTAGDADVWNVTASGGAVWLKFGPGTPVAAADDGWLLLDGQSRDFAASTDAEKLAIKDV